MCVRATVSAVECDLRHAATHRIPFIPMYTHTENKGMHTDRKSKERDRELVELLSGLLFVPPRMGRSVCQCVSYRLSLSDCVLTAPTRPTTKIWRKQLPPFSIFSLLSLTACARTAVIQAADVSSCLLLFPIGKKRRERQNNGHRWKRGEKSIDG